MESSRGLSSPSSSHSTSQSSLSLSSSDFHSGKNFLHSSDASPLIPCHESLQYSCNINHPFVSLLQDNTELNLQGQQTFTPSIISANADVFSELPKPSRQNLKSSKNTKKDIICNNQMHYYSIADKNVSSGMPSSSSTTSQQIITKIPKQQQSWLDLVLKDAGSAMDNIKTDLSSAPSMTTYFPPTVGTTSTQAATGFLKEIDTMERRGILARHELFCQKMKHVQFMEEYEVEEAAQADITVADALFAGNINKKRSREDSLSDDSTSTFDKRSYVKLNEPYFLRMSIYQKISIFFQQFYNDHDVARLASCLFFPLCNQQVMRTFAFWEENAWKVHNASILKRSNHPFATAVHKGSTCGVQSMIDSLGIVFQKLPDSLMFFGDISVREYYPYPNSTARGVIFRTPYTYMFKVPLSEAKTSTLPQELVIPDPPFSTIHSPLLKLNDSVPISTAAMVDIELEGYLEVHFSSNNEIIAVFDHTSFITSKNNNCPFTSIKPLIRHMGFAG